MACAARETAEAQRHRLFFKGITKGGVDSSWGQDRITSSVFAAEAAKVGFEPIRRSRFSLCYNPARYRNLPLLDHKKRLLARGWSHSSSAQGDSGDRHDDLKGVHDDEHSTNRASNRLGIIPQKCDTAIAGGGSRSRCRSTTDLSSAIDQARSNSGHFFRFCEIGMRHDTRQ